MNLNQIIGLVLAGAILMLAAAVFNHAGTGRYLRTADGLLLDSRTGEVWAGLKLTPSIREEVGWELPQHRAWIRTVAPLSATTGNDKLSAARPAADD